MCSKKSLLGQLNVSEDSPIAHERDSERHQHADHDEKDDVMTRRSTVPETLLRLGVEGM